MGSVESVWPMTPRLEVWSNRNKWIMSIISEEPDLSFYSDFVFTDRKAEVLVLHSLCYCQSVSQAQRATESF